MSRKAFASILVVVTALFAVACGGGGVPQFDQGTDVEYDVANPDTIQDNGTPDVGIDVEPDTRPEVELDVEPELPPVDAKEVEDDIVPDVVPDGVEETSEDIQVIDFCPCDTNVNEPVCGVNDVTFTSPQCAACSLCAPDPANCPSCTGAIACQGKPENFIKRMTACDVCPCNLQTECERLSREIEQCKEVCGVDGKTEYADLCALKTAKNCDAGYDEHIGSFGKCVVTCPACEEFDNDPENPLANVAVCGSDGNTYKNQCWLANCPSVDGVTKTCNQACPCP
ncbi:MAG TPA: Kazal-type serine protease inhibitor domain-containing protein [Myxococcota bacterium]|nr:Kazal-type serine protease inhibitor domain-containing protein [Myxococcota bacterium]